MNGRIISRRIEMDAFAQEVTEKTRHLFVERKYALRSSATEKYAYGFGLSQMREYWMLRIDQASWAMSRAASRLQA